MNINKELDELLNDPMFEVTPGRFKKRFLEYFCFL